VRIDARLVGMVIVGGVRPEGWPPAQSQIETIAADLGVEPATVTEHADGVYDLDAADRHRVLVSLPKIADLVTALAAQRSELLDRFSQIAALAGMVTTQDLANPNPMRQGSSL